MFTRHLLASFIVAISAATLVSCGPSEKKTTGSKLFENPDILKVYQLADERKAAELLPYLKNPNPTVRLRAALAFASMPDSSNCVHLAPLLSDSIPALRIAAAYALGQTNAHMATELLGPAFMIEKDSEVKAALLEALGKTFGKEGNRFFYATDPVDDVEKQGWAKGVAWYFYRGYNASELMSRMPYMLYSAGYESKYALAFAMTRYKGEWFNENDDYVTKWLSTERDPGLRSLMMSMLGKMSSPKVVESLISHATTLSEDERVKVNAIRSMAKLMKSYDPRLNELVKDPNNNVVLEALILISGLNPGDADKSMVVEACSQRNAEIVAQSLRLYCSSDDSTLNSKLVEGLSKCTTTADSNFYIRAMGCSGKLFHNQLTGFVMNAPALSSRTSAADALVESHVSGTWPADIDFVSICTEAVNAGDPGVVAIMALHLRDEEMDFKSKKINTRFLSSALNKLEMPKEIETVNEVIRTINYLDGSSIEENKAGAGHPVDWEKVKQIPVNQQVKIVTRKGDIVVELKVEDAPASVANFLSLVESGFYNHKIFHRVVPNFVIQAGCPRGDGWGSSDYCIRSEFTLHDYSKGAVGMASAGPDTESCQWFITHVPTPLLEGRYTIFGYVVGGMEIVSRIGIGDEIVKIEIL